MAHRFAAAGLLAIGSFTGQRAVIRGCRDERVSKGLAATIALTVVTINGRAQDAPPAEIGPAEPDSAGQRKRGAVRVMVYWGTYHAFDVPSLRNGRQFLEHRLEYNEDAFGRSVEEVRSFLCETLGG